jgi:hypothetical protein
LTSSCANPHTKSFGTLLSMLLTMSQALVILPQITKHLSNHDHLHWLVPRSPCSCFNSLIFFCILRILD